MLRGMTTDELQESAEVARQRARAKAKGKRGKTPKPAEICGAVLASGAICKRKAGWGTNHPGVAACRDHDQRQAASRARHVARPSLELLVGHKVDINPMEALLMCVRITAAEVAYFSSRIGELDDNQITVRPRQEQIAQKDGVAIDLRQTKELNIWIRARKESMRDLARFSKMALDAGVEERLVRVAESVGDSIAKAIRSILDDLDLSADQAEQAPEIVRKHLRLLSAA